MGTKSERRGRKVFYWIAEPSYNRVATERTSFWWFRKRLSRVQSSREASSHTEIHKTWNLNYPASRNLLSFVVNFFHISFVFSDFQVHLQQIFYVSHLETFSDIIEWLKYLLKLKGGGALKGITRLCWRHDYFSSNETRISTSQVNPFIRYPPKH